MSHSQFPRIKIPFELRLAWLNLRDKHMTTGRINQVSSNAESGSEPLSWDGTQKNTSSFSSSSSTILRLTSPRTAHTLNRYGRTRVLLHSPVRISPTLSLVFLHLPHSLILLHTPTVQSCSRLWLVEFLRGRSPQQRRVVHTLYQTASSPPILRAEHPLSVRLPSPPKPEYDSDSGLSPHSSLPG